MTMPAEFQNSFASTESARTKHILAFTAVNAAKAALDSAKLAFDIGRFKRNAADDYTARVKVRDAQTALRQAETAQRAAKDEYEHAEREHELVCEILGVKVAS